MLNVNVKRANAQIHVKAFPYIEYHNIYNCILGINDYTVFCVCLSFVVQCRLVEIFSFGYFALSVSDMQCVVT